MHDLLKDGAKMTHNKNKRKASMKTTKEPQTGIDSHDTLRIPPIIHLLQCNYFY